MRKSFLLLSLCCLAVLSCKEPEIDNTEDPFVKVDQEQISAPAEGTDAVIAISSNCYWNIAATDPDGKAVTWVSLSESSGQGSKSVGVTVSANIKTEERRAIVSVTAPSIPDLTITVTINQAAGESSSVEGYSFPLIETFEIDSPDSRKLTNAVIGGNECAFKKGAVLARSNPDAKLEFVCPSHTQPSAGDDADKSIHRSIRMDGFEQGESILISFPVKDALSGDLRLMLGARACSFTKAGWSYYWGTDGDNWNKIEIENAVTPGSDAVWNIIYFSIPLSQAVPAGGTIRFKITADQKTTHDYISISNTICVCPAKGETGNVPVMDDSKIAFSTCFNDLVESYAPDMRYPLGWLRSASTSYASGVSTFNDHYIVPSELAPFAVAKGCYEKSGYLQVGYYDESLWTRYCAGSYTIKIGERLKQMGVALTDAKITLKACNMKDFRGYDNLAVATIACGEDSYVMENLKDGEFQKFSKEFKNIGQESTIEIFSPRLTEEELAALGRGEKAKYLQDYRFFIDDIVVELTNIQSKGTELTATLENTRSHLEGTKVLWDANDEISVFCAEGNTKFSTSDGGGTAIFRGPGITLDNTVTALFPYFENATSTAADGIVFPGEYSEQKAVNGTFDQKLNLAAAKYEGNKTLAFKNAGAFVSFTLTQLGADTLRRIEIKANDGTPIAFDGNGSIKWNGTEPVLAPAADAVKSAVVKLTPKASVFATGDTYYVWVLPGEYKDGLTVTLISPTQMTATKTFPSSQTIIRSQVLNLGDIGGLEWKEKETEKKTLHFDFSGTPQAGWPTSDKWKDIAKGDPNPCPGDSTCIYKLDGVDYAFIITDCGNATQARTCWDPAKGGLIWYAGWRYLGLPAIEGYSLIKVTGSLCLSSNSKRKAGITKSVVANNTTDKNEFVTGGEEIAWATKDQVYSYNLEGTEPNTVYYLCCTATSLGTYYLDLVYEKNE